MPAWLLNDLIPIAETVVGWLLQLLEGKYPALKISVEKLKEILSVPNPPSGVQVCNHLDGLCQLPKG